MRLYIIQSQPKTWTEFNDIWIKDALLKGGSTSIHVQLCKVISFQFSFIMTAVYYCKWRPQWVTVVGPTYCTCKLTNHSVRTTEPVCYFQIFLLNGNFRQCSTVHLEIVWLDKEYGWPLRADRLEVALINTQRVSSAGSTTTIVSLF